MNLSTELVVIKNRLQSLLDINQELLEPLYQQLRTISRELQQEIEVTRLQPIAIAFRKVPKIVREASKITNKNVEVLFSGDHLGLDKSLLDKLQNPFYTLSGTLSIMGLKLQKKDAPSTNQVRVHFI